MPGISSGRSSKPVKLVKGHRSKAEKEFRERQEKALLTGCALKEWDNVKDNPVAHKEFVRLKKLFTKIEKNDSLHEAVINRYCMLHAECVEIEKIKQQCNDDINKTHEAYQKDELELSDYIKTRDSLYEKYLDLDKKIMDKRKMLLSIEKENLMTMASALRSVMKKPVENGKEDPMGKLLRGV